MQKKYCSYNVTQMKTLIANKFIPYSLNTYQIEDYVAYLIFLSANKQNCFEIYKSQATSNFLTYQKYTYNHNVF